MHTVVISKNQKPSDPNSSLATLLKDMEMVLGVKSRIYSINVWIPNDKKKFVLRTTSKDLALKLCSFDWQVQYHLALFLFEETRRARCSELLLCFKMESNNSEEGIHATMIMDRDEIIFSLSIAR